MIFQNRVAWFDPLCEDQASDLWNENGGVIAAGHDQDGIEFFIADDPKSPNIEK